MQTANATGTYTQDITGYNPTETVYYRIVGNNVNGTTYGSTVLFKLTGGSAAAQSILYNGVLLLVVAAICIGVIQLTRTGGWLAGLTGTIIGLIVFYIVKAVIEGMW